MRSLNEKSALLSVPSINKDIEAAPVQLVNNQESRFSSPLNFFHNFINSHSRAIHVAADSLSTLAPFQVINNNLQGWPDSYEKNLDNLNIAFGIYFAVQLSLSVLYHHSYDEEKKAPLPLAIPSFLLLTSMVMMSYVLDSLQDDLLAGQAQLSNPQGGMNNVSTTNFWLYGFSIPALIAFSYSALQFGKEVHNLLSDRNYINTDKLASVIPGPIKTTIKLLDKIFTLGVESIAVFGSLYQDLVIYSLSYAGVNLLNYQQFYTTMIYAGGMLLGFATAALFETNILSKIISKSNFEKAVVIIGGALGLSIFYSSNIEDTLKKGVNPSTMTTMVGIPTLFIAGATAYGIYNTLCKKHRKEVVIKPVVSDLIENDPESNDSEQRSLIEQSNPISVPYPPRLFDAGTAHLCMESNQESIGIAQSI